MVKPAVKRALGVVDRAGGAQRQRLVEHLIVPQGLVIGVEEEVAVALDQPGHEGRAGKVDHPGAGGSGEIGPGRDDAVAVDQHLPAGVHRIAVEHAAPGAGGAFRRGAAISNAASSQADARREDAGAFIAASGPQNGCQWERTIGRYSAIVDQAACRSRQTAIGRSESSRSSTLAC